MVHVGDVVFDGKTQANARELLDQAKKHGFPAEVVKATSEGFSIPAELANKIGPPEGEAAMKDNDQTLDTTAEVADTKAEVEETKAAPKRRQRRAPTKKN